ncbi:hypothetical protein HDU97_000544 [Phlyctochytrium planicorne]|nr:hypothetical protein HDU97_000544 [Phlyctochytrium planicorne]
MSTFAPPPQQTPTITFASKAPAQTPHVNPVDNSDERHQEQSHGDGEEERRRVLNAESHSDFDRSQLQQNKNEDNSSVKKVASSSLAKSPTMDLCNLVARDEDCEGSRAQAYKSVFSKESSKEGRAIILPPPMLNRAPSPPKPTPCCLPPAPPAPLPHPHQAQQHMHQMHAHHHHHHHAPPHPHHHVLPSPPVSATNSPIPETQACPPRHYRAYQGDVVSHSVHPSYPQRPYEVAQHQHIHQGQQATHNATSPPLAYMNGLHVPTASPYQHQYHHSHPAHQHLHPVQSPYPSHVTSPHPPAPSYHHHPQPVYTTCCCNHHVSQPAPIPRPQPTVVLNGDDHHSRHHWQYQQQQRREEESRPSNLVISVRPPISPPASCPPTTPTGYSPQVVTSPLPRPSRSAEPPGVIQVQVVRKGGVETLEPTLASPSVTPEASPSTSSSLANRKRNCLPRADEVIIVSATIGKRSRDDANQKTPEATGKATERPPTKRQKSESGSDVEVTPLSSPAKSSSTSAAANTESFPCDFPSCNKTFSSKERLRCHRKCHLLTRSHVCEVCKEGFFRRQDLARHMATHSVVKGFECSLCGTRFTRMDARQRHVRARRCAGAINADDETVERALAAGLTSIVVTEAEESSSAAA